MYLRKLEKAKKNKTSISVRTPCIIHAMERNYKWKVKSKTCAETPERRRMVCTVRLCHFHLLGYFFFSWRVVAIDFKTKRNRFSGSHHIVGSTSDDTYVNPSINQSINHQSMNQSRRITASSHTFPNEVLVVLGLLWFCRKRNWTQVIVDVSSDLILLIFTNNPLTTRWLVLGIINSISLCKGMVS